MFFLYTIINFFWNSLDFEATTECLETQGGEIDWSLKFQIASIFDQYHSFERKLLIVRRFNIHSNYGGGINGDRR